MIVAPRSRAQLVDQPGADRVHPLDLGEIDGDPLGGDLVDLLAQPADAQQREVAAKPQHALLVLHAGIEFGRGAHRLDRASKSGERQGGMVKSDASMPARQAADPGAGHLRHGPDGDARPDLRPVPLVCDDPARAVAGAARAGRRCCTTLLYGLRLIDRGRLKEWNYRLLIGRPTPERLEPVVQRFADRQVETNILPGARTRHRRGQGGRPPAGDGDRLLRPLRGRDRQAARLRRRHRDRDPARQRGPDRRQDRRRAIATASASST